VVVDAPSIPEAFWSFPPAVVTGQDPDSGTNAKRGSTVTISG